MLNGRSYTQLTFKGACDNFLQASKLSGALIAPKVQFMSKSLILTFVPARWKTQLVPTLKYLVIAQENH